MNLAGDGKNRTRPSTVIYRLLMEEFENRRQQLGLSMGTDEVGVNDLAGAADGYYAKMIFPDTPSGRQARWETVDEFASVLFGSGYAIKIIPGELNRKTLAALSVASNPSENAVKVRHWRHSRHFSELGKKGGVARSLKLSPAKRRAIAKKANRAWQRAQKAKRQGEAHKRANEEAMAQ